MIKIGLALTAIDFYCVSGMSSGARGVKHAFAVVRDLWRLLGKQTILFGSMMAGASYLYGREEVTESLRHLL
jgi:hypothetical protein